MSVKAQLRELGLHPRKGLGQNFLVARGVLDQILAAAEIDAQDTVLEIGPGLGTLTRALAEHARRVVAVELDQQLVAVLREQLQLWSEVRIVAGDILSLDVSELMRQQISGVFSDSAGTTEFNRSGYKVVANIPYNITSAVLRHLLEARLRPRLIVLMVQREVAQRITAKPGEMSLLSVSVQFYGQARLVHRVPAGAFYPMPKVDSAIIRIDPHAELPLSEREIGSFFDVVRAGFSQRRKQLRNALSRGLGLPMQSIETALVKASIAADLRAQTLSVSEWIVLYRALARV